MAFPGGKVGVLRSKRATTTNDIDVFVAIQIKRRKQTMTNVLHCPHTSYTNMDNEIICGTLHSEWVCECVGGKEGEWVSEYVGKWVKVLLYRVSLTCSPELAMSRGMDFVTITDHDAIHGVKEIAHYNNVITGTEVTTYFPDRVKVHVVCLDISEQQHKEIDRIRENIYDLVDYLSKQDIIHFVAHPLYKVDNGGLTLEHFEKLILLFKRHEVLNGGRYERTNRVAQQSLSSLTQDDIDRLANKHDVEPVGEEPWKKYFVGGSDDHGGLFVGSCYTEVLVNEMTKEALLDGIRNGRTSACGKTDGSLTLAHQMIRIAYQYVMERMENASSKREELMFRWLFSRNGKKSYYAKKFKQQMRRDARKKFFSLKLNSDKDEFSLFDEIHSILDNVVDLAAP